MQRLFIFKLFNGATFFGKLRVLTIASDIDGIALLNVRYFGGVI